MIAWLIGDTFIRPVLLGLASLGFALTGLFLATRRRDVWLRMTRAEAALWRSLGLPAHQVESIQRYEESPAFITLIRGVVVACAVITVAAFAVYLYFPELQRLGAVRK